MISKDKNRVAYSLKCINGKRNVQCEVRKCYAKATHWIMVNHTTEAINKYGVEKALIFGKNVCAKHSDDWLNGDVNGIIRR